MHLSTASPLTMGWVFAGAFLALPGQTSDIVLGSDLGKMSGKSLQESVVRSLLCTDQCQREMDDSSGTSDKPFLSSLWVSGYSDFVPTGFFTGFVVIGGPGLLSLCGFKT